MATRKILVVDDLADLQDLLETALGDLPRCQLLFAPTLADAARLFHEHATDIVAIFMDGCVEGKVLDTLPLIRAIRAYFETTGYLIGSPPPSNRAFAASARHSTGRPPSPPRSPRSAARNPA